MWGKTAYKIFDVVLRALTVLASLALFFYFAPPSALAAENMAVTVSINFETKGDYFVIIEDDGDILFRLDDLKEMGLKELKGEERVEDGKQYVSLKSLRASGLEFSLDKEKFKLDLTAEPTLFMLHSIDIIHADARDNVYYPAETSAFFNYRLEYLGVDQMTFRGLTFNNTIGGRRGDLLFTSESVYNVTDFEKRFTRLMTAVTYDRRVDMLRMTAGDLTAASGEFGSTMNLGGIGISKLYRMNPYYIKYPTLSISGLAATQSDVEVYMDGVRVSESKLLPGEFELSNIYRNAGTHDVEILIRDPYGNVQRISRPFYQSDALLRQGLHEYSYNAGFVRQGFGYWSDRYSIPALSFFHNYGVSQTVTAGLRAEYSGQVYNAGPYLSFNAWDMGLVTGTLSVSGNNGRTGVAGSINHSFTGGPLTTRLLYRNIGKEYSYVSGIVGVNMQKFDAAAGASYITDRYGVLSFDYMYQARYFGPDSRVVSLGYSKGIGGASISANVKRRQEEKSSYEAMLSIVYSYDGGSTSAYFSKNDLADTQSIQSQINAPPLSTGLALRSSYDRVAYKGQNVTNILNHTAEYDSRYANFRGDFRNISSDTFNNEYYDLSVAGSVAYVRGSWGLTRPINDSFGLVKVGKLKDIPVSFNNRLIGKTDDNGEIFIPYMNAFTDNTVNIGAKSVPIEYSLSDVSATISPPYRSGNCMYFEAIRNHAYVGNLKVRESGGTMPLEFYDVTVKAGDKELKFPTGQGGEFYFDTNPSRGEKLRAKRGEAKNGKAKAPANVSCDVMDAPVAFADVTRFDAYVDYKGRTCVFSIPVNEGEDPIVELGDIVCNIPAEGSHRYKEKSYFYVPRKEATVPVTPPLGSISPQEGATGGAGSGTKKDR